MNHPSVFYQDIEPPSYGQAKLLIGGYIQLLHLSNGDQMLVDEEGILKDLPYNHKATQLFGHVIVGDVVILQGDARWLD